MANSIKFENIESRQFAFITGSGPCCSTGYLERKADGLSTARFVCSEGFESYCELKRAWRKDKGIFDSLCWEYFTPGSTVWDKEGNYGYLDKAGKFRAV